MNRQDGRAEGYAHIFIILDRKDDGVEGHAHIFFCENSKTATQWWTTISRRMLDPTKKRYARSNGNEKPQQEGRRGETAFRIKSHTCQRHLEGSNKPCAHKDPETPQRFSQTSLWTLECLLRRHGSAGFNSMWIEKFQIVKLDLEKAEGPEIKLPTPVGSQKNQKSSRKISTSALLTMPKPLTVWIKINSEKFLKKWEYQTPYLPPEKSVCRSRRNRTRQVTTDWFQIGKGSMSRPLYCHPAYLTSMQSTSCEMLGWMKHKLESSLPGEISITLHKQMILPLWQKVKN